MDGEDIYVSTSHRIAKGRHLQRSHWLILRSVIVLLPFAVWLLLAGIPRLWELWVVP